jgi:hypothetical protein
MKLHKLLGILMFVALVVAIIIVGSFIMGLKHILIVTGGMLFLFFWVWIAIELVTKENKR